MPFTRGHALLIGVGTYPKASFLNVPQTAEDVTALAAVLKDERFCGYPVAQTQPALLREQATREQIFSALDDLAKRTEPTDTVFLFYVGHGQQGTDGNYYLTTHDTEMRGMEVLAGSGIPIGTFLEKIQAIQAERLLFLCNACYSGQIPPELLPTKMNKPFVTPRLPKDAGEALLSAGKGRVLITACSEGQESQTGSGNITIFTQAVIEALKGYGVANQNGFISVFDLYQHVYARVKEQAETMGKDQEPELTIVKGSGLFPVALYKGTSSPGTFDDSAPMPLAGPGIRSVTQGQSQRSLAIYVKTVTKTKNITASGTGAVAAEKIYGPVYGGGNTYTQTAHGSGIAQAAGPGAQATVNYRGTGEANRDDARTRAIAQLGRLIGALEESVDFSHLSRVAYTTAKAQVTAAIEELENADPIIEVILDYLHAAQGAVGSSDSQFATLVAEAIASVETI